MMAEVKILGVIFDGSLGLSVLDLFGVSISCEVHPSVNVSARKEKSAQCCVESAAQLIRSTEPASLFASD